MTKEEINAYWNYSRVLKTIPEKDYEQPQIKQFLMTYGCLEEMFFNHIREINDTKENENDKETGKGKDK